SAGGLTPQPFVIEQEIAKPDALPRLRGKTWKAMRYADWGIRSYSDVIFAAGKPVRENPDLVRPYVRALARAMQYILDNPDETVQMVAAFPDQVEKADKLAWRWKIQNALFTSDDTKKNGLLWMEPAVWDEMMAFYKEYDQIPRVVPTDE